MRVAAFPVMTFMAALLLAAPDASAQSVSGTVSAAESGDSIAGARVVLRDSNGATVRQTLTDRAGSFFLPLMRSGGYVLDVSHDGYAAMQPVRINVAEGEAVSVEIRLSLSVVRIEPLTVTARRRDPRHDGSYEGALARHRQFAPVGSRRVVLATDLELRSAISVAGALQFLTFGRKCWIMYVNGALVNNSGWSEAWLEWPAADIDALEYYLRYTDAPQSYRFYPSNVIDPHKCSVLALWTMQEKRPPVTRPWLRLLSASVAVLALALISY